MMAIGFFRRMSGKGKISGSDVARYLLEFVIVFVGVYLAFLLTDYQEELREREVRVKYYESLILEFKVLVQHLDNEVLKLENHLKIIEEIENGKHPFIPVSDMNFPFLGGVVDAAFEGRNFEALDRRILNNIVRGRPGLEILNHNISMLNQLTADLLVIQLTDEHCCYDEEGTLLPHLEWYPRLIREIHRLNRGLRIGLVDNAIPDLEQSKRALEASWGSKPPTPESEAS